ncbi:MAG: M24 family metallopeptidase, partial [Chlamydiales bacterium]
MEISLKIQEIQQRLQEHEIDGWLIFDNHASNRFAHTLLAIPEHLMLTRRFFYWIPKEGGPKKVVHRIEEEHLSFLPGEQFLYLSWRDLDEALAKILLGAKRVAMEYSPHCMNPYVSTVDGGTIEQIRDLGVEVISSDDLLQHFTSVLDEEQIESHLQAAAVLEDVVGKAWELIADKVRHDKRITEYDVQKFIISEFMAHNCIADYGPICAVNGHSSLPHYMALKKRCQEIVRGDFVLIDLWCKKDLPYAIYADITRVAVVASDATPRQHEVFQTVRNAQKKGYEFIKKRFEKGEPV